MKKLTLGLALGALLAGCSQQPEKGEFTIDAHVANAPLGTVYLEELTLQEAKVVDTTTLKDASGKFSLKGMVPEQGLYRIRFGNDKFILLGLDAGNMKVNGDYEHLDQVKVDGSEATTAIQQLLNEASRKNIALTQQMKAVDSLQGLHVPDSVLQPKIAALQQQQQELQQSILKTAETTQHPAVAVFAMSMVDPQALLADKKLVGSMKTRFPNNNLVNSLTGRLAEIEKASATGADEANMTAVKIGEPAPDFTLPDPSGKMVSLSSFKGKYVLVDFWASWCKPCRMENPNVVKAYNQYKNKNFTVLGVSLDQKKDAWLQAIKDDGLAWNHVSDLKFWESAVVPLYGINAIPTNFLLDPQGKVIASNLRGEALEQKLGEVVK